MKTPGIKRTLYFGSLAMNVVLFVYYMRTGGYRASIGNSDNNLYRIEELKISNTSKHKSDELKSNGNEENVVNKTVRPWQIPISNKTIDKPWLKQRVRDMARSHPSSLKETKRCDWTKRSSQANSYCENNNSGIPKIVNYSKLQLMLDHENQMIFCIVFKSASSTMKRYFASLRDGFDVNHLHKDWYLKTKGITMIRDHTPQEQKDFISRYRKSIVVRHPFDRLRATYYNKFVDSNLIGSEYFKAIREYRVNKRDRSRVMHFDEYARYLLQHSDVHWTTVQQTCDPCHIGYDYILKIETLYEDLKDFTQNVLNRNYNDVFTEVYHPGKHNQDTIQSDVKDVQEFSKLTDELYSSLLERYTDDMHMFGYEFDKDSSKATCGGSNTECC